jgi:hypothetical protein
MGLSEFQSHESFEGERMRRATVLIIPIVCLGISALFTHALNVSDSATAAPIPKAGPITLEGTIEDLRWSPEEFRKGMAGMSGTLGQERTFPARYVVVLRDINILDGHGGYGLAVDVAKRKATLLLVHPADDQFLKKSMRIRVSGYEEGGDEGGSWSKHVSIEVLKP